MILSASLLACSDNPISVLDSSWECKAVPTGKECIVEFEIENKSPFVVTANIMLRTRSLGKGAITNRIVFEKQYYELLSANETKKIKKIVTIEERFINIVVLAWKSNME